MISPINEDSCQVVFVFVLVLVFVSIPMVCGVMIIDQSQEGGHKPIKALEKGKGSMESWGGGHL